MKTAGAEFLYCTRPGLQASDYLTKIHEAVWAEKEIENLLNLLLLKSNTYGFDTCSVARLVCLTGISVNNLMQSENDYIKSSAMKSLCCENKTSLIVDALLKDFACLRRYRPDYAADHAQEWIFMVGYHSA